MAISAEEQAPDQALKRFPSQATAALIHIQMALVSRYIQQQEYNRKHKTTLNGNNYLLGPK